MCYSAMVEAAFKKFVRRYGAVIDFAHFERLYRHRLKDKKIKIPRAIDFNFLEPQTPIEKQIKQHIDEYNAIQRKECEEGLFTQQTRLTNATRALESKTTKALQNDVRVATNKIAQFKYRLADLNDPEPRENDARIYPMVYAPLVVMEDGKYVVKPMRYHCRPFGVDAEDWDRKFSGTYNARRETMEEKFWKQLFGKKHAFMIVHSFFENVSLHNFERRELRPNEPLTNVVLHFDPQPKADMLLACLWDRWIGPDKEELLSFAAITGEPPEEVAAAGHDRCVIPLKEENLAAWLNPEGMDKAALNAMLDDRERPYYEHRLAA
jgi:putative SOS response-associated peptidase YedK